MSKKTPKAKSKKPTIRRVSGRDQEIYHQVAIEGQTQQKVAAEKKITQPRVSKIVKRVNLWLSESVPYGFDELPRESRLNMGARIHRMKLQWMYEQAAGAWDVSKKALKTIKEKVIKGETVLETTVKTQSGNYRLLGEARKIAESQIVFDGFSLDGKVDISCAGRPFEMPPQTEDEMMAGLKADYDVYYPQLVKWEAEKKEREREGGGEGEIDECGVMSDECGRKSAEVVEVLSEGLSNRLSVSPLCHRNNDVTSLPGTATDSRETVAEVLYSAPTGHVVSEGDLRSGRSAGSETRAELTGLSNRLSEIPVFHQNNDVTSVPVTATDSRETVAEVLYSAPVADAASFGTRDADVYDSRPAISTPPTLAAVGHVASDEPKLVINPPANSEDRPPPQLTYQTPLPRYQELSDGTRRQIPWMRMGEDPNPRKLPGMWLKHPTCYGKSDNPGAKWEPCG